MPEETKLSRSERVTALAKERVKNSMGALLYEDALVVAESQIAADEEAEKAAAETKSKRAPKDSPKES